MNIVTRFLIAIGAIEKEHHHVMHPITRMHDELEALAERKRTKMQNAEDAIRKHEADKVLAVQHTRDAEKSAAAVRALLASA